jgi:hypothetical protein
VANQHEGWTTSKSITAGGVAIQGSAKRKSEEQTSSSYLKKKDIHIINFI